MKESLEKRYGLTVAFSMVVGMVIGVGIFFKAEKILQQADCNPKIALLAWAIGGIISILSGLTVAEIAAAVTESGGMIAWIKKVYGKKLAFLVGWAQLVIYFPAMILTLAYYFGLYTTNFLGITGNDNLIWFIAIFTIIFVYIVNIFTTSIGGKIQTCATFAKIIPLLLITVLGFLSSNNSKGVFFTPEPLSSSTSSPLLLLGLALVPVMFAFDGWIFVGNIAGDLKDIKRDLPRSIIWGLGFVAIFYLLLNVALLHVFSSDILSKVGMSGVANKLFGEMGAKFIFLGIMISAFGGLNGMILASTRVPYTLGIEESIVKKEFFSKVDEKHKQPINSAFVMCLMCLIWVVYAYLTKSQDTIGDIAVALFWLINCSIFLAVFILRKKEPELERPYKVPFYPLIPILALLGGVSIFIYASISSPRNMLISVVLVLLGLLFYRENK